MKMIPSSLNLDAYFAIARFNAAFEIPYPTNVSKLFLFATIGDPAVVEIVRHFFVVPARRRGRKALMVWMGPMVFVLNYEHHTLVKIL